MERWWHYLAPGAAQLATGLACLGVGVQHGRLPVVGPRTLDRWVTVLVTSGRGWSAAPDGTRRPVAAPAVLWLRPGVPHHYGPGGDGWSEYFVDFTGPAVAAYAELGLVPEADVVPLTSAVPARAVAARIAAASTPASGPTSTRPVQRCWRCSAGPRSCRCRSASTRAGPA